MEYFAGPRVFALLPENMEAEQVRALIKMDEKNQRSRSLLDTGICPKRYREIVSRRGQEDLDTNRGAAGRKTWRGGPPIQGKGQRECSRHA